MRANTNRIVYTTMVLLGLLDVLVIFHSKTESYGTYYSVLSFVCGLTIMALFALTLFRIQKVIKDIGTKSWLTGMLKISNIPFLALAIFLYVYATNSFDENWEKIPGVTEIKNGQYLITNHGEIVKTLTKEEYNSFADMERNLWVSAFLFFGAGTLLLNRFDNNKAANTMYVP
jgi:hypothetical protein